MDQLLHNYIHHHPTHLSRQLLAGFMSLVQDLCHRTENLHAVHRTHTRRSAPIPHRDSHACRRGVTPPMCFSDGMHVEVLGVYKYGSFRPPILPVSPLPNEGGATPCVSYVWYYTIILCI